MGFDKLLLNNKIICLKKEVLKAKTQVIQNVVKKIAHFKEKAKTDEKFQKKVDVLDEELKVLKKLNPRELVKAALLLEKDPKAVLTTGTSSASERSLARIWEHKTFKVKLKELKDTFQLDDEENRKGLRSMGSKKQAKKSAKKGQKKTGSKKPSKVSEEGEAEEGNAEGAEAEEASEEQNSAPEVKKKAPKKQKRVPKKQEKIEFSSESEAEAEEPEANKSVDSFFVTSSGSNYVAAAPRSKAPDFEEPRGRRFEHEEDTFQESRKRSFRNFHQRDEEPRFQRPSFREKPQEDLHPSWKAKQQFKIKPFEGKKTNFDEPQKSEGLHPSWAAKKDQFKIKPFEGKKISFDEPQKTEGLHPSWAAKKSKPAIASFQGSKIKFDD